MRVLPTLVAGLVLAAALAPAASAKMSRADLEATLATLQEDVDAALEAYEADRTGEALAAAQRVTGAFTYSGTGTSELEVAIKDASALAIGDRVKALASRYETAIANGASLEDVRAIADELAPNLNRLVLVAQGKATAASQRMLRSPDEVDAALTEVLDLVAEAEDLAKRGKKGDAVAAAKDAFFAFEINGLGPDTSTVDDDLENRAENMIVNFDENTVVSNPGLSQLIENDAPATEVTAQAEALRRVLAEVAELLKATLPPATLGDANADGKVTIVDALLVAQAALGVRGKTTDMDANRDGKVTIVDALLIAQAALGIRTL